MSVQTHAPADARPDINEGLDHEAPPLAQVRWAVRRALDVVLGRYDGSDAIDHNGDGSLYPRRCGAIQSLLQSAVTQLDRTTPASPADNDTEAVRKQLVDAAQEEISIKPVHDAHPYGSTVAVEKGYEVEFTGARAVVIDVETDSIPVEVEATVPVLFAEGNLGDVDIDVPVRFHNPQVQGGRLTYDAEIQ